MDFNTKPFYLIPLEKPEKKMLHSLILMKREDGFVSFVTI